MFAHFHHISIARRAAIVLAVGGVLFALPGKDAVPAGAIPPGPAPCPDEFDLADVRLERELRISLLPPLDVIVTAYSSTASQTDATPFTTASMTRVRPGVIALSRDLIRRYNPRAPFDFGDRVHVEGHGVFTVEDTMNERYSRRADIWFASTTEAIAFGKKELTLSRVGPAGGGGISGCSPRSTSAPSK